MKLFNRLRTLSYIYKVLKDLTLLQLMRIVYSVLLIFSLTSSIPEFIKSQTLIFNDIGNSYTNIDGTINDNYPVDISKCTSISFSIDYSFNAPWIGSGNMESSDECNFGIPCFGDPTDPLQGSCNTCWDFFWVNFFVGSTNVGGDLIGEAGTTDLEQAGTITAGPICTNGETTATIDVVNQNWAAAETNSFTNVQIYCWEGQPEEPVLTTCPGSMMNLDGDACDVSVVNDWAWSTSGAASIANVGIQNTTASGAMGGDQFTLTTTDVNGCMASTTTAVMASSPLIVDIDPVPPFVYCPGGLLEVLANPINPAWGYAWTSSEGYTATQGVPVWSHTGTGFYAIDPGSAGTTITIDLVVTDVSGCTGSSQLMINVGDPQPPVITVNGMNSPYDKVCFGDPVTLDVSNGGLVADGWTYNWSGPAGWGSSDKNPTLTTADAGYIFPSGFYNVTVTDASGCPEIGNVMVEFERSWEIGLSGGGTICKGNCLDIPIAISSMANPPGGTPGQVNVDLGVNGFPIPGFPAFSLDLGVGTLQVCYDDPGVGSFTAPNTVHLPTFLPGGTGTLDFLNISSGNNPDCYTLTPPASASITLADSPEAIALEDPINICEGEVIFLEDIGTGGIEWDFVAPMGSGLPGNLNSATPSSSYSNANPVTHTGTYLIISKNAEGCADTAEVVVVVDPDPVISPIDIFGCDNGDGTITYDLSLPSNDPSPGNTITWYEDNTKTTQISNPYTVANTVTTIFVEATTGAIPCINGATLNLMSLPVVSLNPQPVPDVCEGSTYTLVELNNDPSIDTWEWMDASGTTIGVATSALPIESIPITGVGAPQTINYTLLVTDMNGCTATTSLAVNIIELPEAIDVDTLQECGTGTDITYDLTMFNSNISGGAATTQVVWYSDMMGTTVIANPAAYTVMTVNLPTTVYATVTDPATGCTSALIDLVLTESPGADYMVETFLPVACDSFRLPLIAPLTTTVEYNDDINGAGIKYTPGKNITTPGIYTLYVFDGSGGCFNDLDQQIQFEIVASPQFLNNPSFTACDSFEIPAYPLDPLGIIPDTVFYIDMNGNPVLPGEFIYANDSIQVVAIADTILGVCPKRDTLIVDILQSPNLGNNASISICEGYDGMIDFMTLIGADQGGEWPSPDITDSTMVSVVSLMQSGSPFTFDYVLEACGSPQTVSVEVTVVSPPNAGTPQSIQICNDGTDSMVDFMTETGADMGGTWTLITNPGSTMISLADSTRVDFTNAEPGTYSFEYSITTTNSADYCDANQNVINIEVFRQANAGMNIELESCLGSILDLDNLLDPNADLGGTFDPGSSGLIISANNEISTSSLSNGDVVVITYNLPANGTCAGDMSEIEITMTMDVSAGDDNVTTDVYCGGEELNLNNFLVNASSGGTFTILNDQSLLTGSTWTVDPSLGSPIMIQYDVGDASTGCPTDDALIQFNVIDGPTLMVTEDVNSICTDECINLTITASGSGLVTTMVNLDDQTGTFYDDTWDLSSSSNIWVCNSGSSTLFNNDTLFISNPSNSLVLSFNTVTDDNCASVIDIPINFTTGESSMSLIDDTLCAGQSIMVGTMVFDESNSSGQVSIPTAAGCDSLVDVDLSFYPEAIERIEGTRCTGWSLVVGTDTYDENNLTGSTILMGQGANGCDSTVVVDIMITDVSENLVQDMYCTDDVVVINGVSYDVDNPTGRDTLIMGSALGCDSVIVVDLNFITGGTGNLVIDTCAGTPITIGNTTFSDSNPSGIAIIEDAGIMGCDSMVNVTINYSDNEIGEITPDICNNEVFITPGGQTLNIDSPESLPEVFGVATNGCDSFVIYRVLLIEFGRSQLMPEVCNGDSYITMGGEVLDADNLSGQDILPGASASGCDSIIDIDLIILFPEEENISPEICAGGSIIINGTVYDESMPSGTEVFPNASVNGCDSIVNITLNVLSNSEFTLTGNYCNADSEIVNGVVYDINMPGGTEVIPGAAANGCDSIVIVDMRFDRSYDILAEAGCDETSDGTITIVSNNGTVLPLLVTVEGTGMTFSANFLPYTFDMPAGSYNITIMDDMDCTSQEVVNVPIGSAGVFDISNPTSDGSNFGLVANTDVGTYDIEWEAPTGTSITCTDCDNPVVTIFDDTEITAVLNYGNGCVLRDTIYLQVEPKVFVYVPTGLNPDSKEGNNILYIATNDDLIDQITVNQFSVYDRWGNMVFDNPNAIPDDAASGWDGKVSTDPSDPSAIGEQVVPGVYVYLIRISVLGENDERQYRGGVTVIR